MVRYPHLLLQQCFSLSVLRTWLVLLIVSAGGCSTSNSTTDTLSDFSQIKDDEVLLVGRVTVLPAVVGASLKQETDTFMPFDGERVLVWLDTNVPENDSRGKMAVTSSSALGLLADWNIPFYIAIPKQTQMLTGLERALREGESLRYVNLVLPEWFTVLVRADDVAVYIGNLRVYVDEFDEIVAVEVVDESKSARQRIRQRFGEQIRFRVSLLAPSDYLQ
ncbi:hypothetical protein L4D06_13105 [Enterovibrio makurazakiensis]|uniref:Uncharacterized protein n=1 Tax=Enterovibrio gelatinilyticus TaxID=2899819 RepID=A0ABT5R2N9_9GAMM|nr:hypothetical protein [Enterovibrio sp. ZSDZ42]MDD1794021.1 hypothetical protein [Enterovibrio sp. ZSDZ42]